jgi:hypothetical protein
MMLPLETLLPLRGLSVTLKFTAPAALRALHQPALTAWLRHLLDDLPGYEEHLTLDAPECGRTAYRAGDYYCFSVFAAAGGEGLLQALLDRLRDLPHGVKVRDRQAPFRDNLVFEAAHDVFSGQSVQQVAGLSTYGADALAAEAGIWHNLDSCVLRWLAPVRLLLPVEQRAGRRGELRYCRHRAEFDFKLLQYRLRDSFADLLRRRGVVVSAREMDGQARAHGADLFWVDFAYYDAAGKEKPMGGLLGAVGFDCADFDLDTWRLWVLGQYLGIGQRRVFGWGRYRLESLEGEFTLAADAETSVRFYRLCENCRADSHDLEGKPVAHWPAVVII